MLDGVSLDQLRTFIACADEGSFSAAARRLFRAQSVVSDLIGGLEAQIGVQLFDRAGRYPKLTPAGTTLLADARGIIAGVDFMKARAKGMSSGLEPELAIVVDVLFPISVIADAAKAFQREFPGTPLRLFVEALGAGYQRVLDGTVNVGVVPLLPHVPPSLSNEHLTGVALVMVAARQHPLASFSGTVPRAELSRHVQLVLTDRSTLSAGVEFNVVSPSTWQLADLFAKHAFLLEGLGWGGMPRHAVQADLSAGRLVELSVEDIPADGVIVPMAAIYPTSTPPGPAGRWLIERLKQCPASTSATTEGQHAGRSPRGMDGAGG